VTILDGLLHDPAESQDAVSILYGGVDGLSDNRSIILGRESFRSEAARASFGTAL
jgi:hypothetical protein